MKRCTGFSTASDHLKDKDGAIALSLITDGLYG